jgi:hypothetical protein
MRGPRREGAATLLLGEMTDGQRIELLASAAYAACTPPAVPEFAELSVLTLRASVEHARRGGTPGAGHPGRDTGAGHPGRDRCWPGTEGFGQPEPLYRFIDQIASL